MLTNELKKGDRIKLRNGWFGTVFDNAKGNTRMVEVEGLYTEIGSVYSHDIVLKIVANSEPIKIEHRPAQIKLRATVEAF